MKKSKVIAIVALLVTLIGLIGLIICVTPGCSKPDKVIKKYVSAINSGKTEKMKKYKYSLSDLTGLISDEYSDLAEELEDYVDEEDDDYADERHSAFMASVFDSSDIPSDIEKLKSVKVIGCVDGKESTEWGMTGLQVKVVLKIDFVDADGENQTIYHTDTIGLMRVKNSYKIVG